MYGCLRKGNDMDEFAARPVADILGPVLNRQSEPRDHRRSGGKMP